MKNVTALPALPARPVRPAAQSARSPTLEAGLTDSMDVAPAALGKIVVDHELDSLEIDAASHDVRRDEAPNLALCESAHDVVSLL